MKNSTMEPLAFARMLNSLQGGIPEPRGKETAYAHAVVGQAVKAFDEVSEAVDKIRGDQDINNTDKAQQTAQTVRLITQPLLEDLHKAQARVNEKSVVLDKTADVLNIVAGQLQLTVIEYEAALIRTGQNGIPH